jgi:proline iminopeptidase
LPARAKELDAVPASLGIRLLVGALGAAALVESALPAAISLVVQRVRS